MPRETIDIEEYREQLGYEVQMLREYGKHRATLPEGWNLDKQEGFVAGMQYAHKLLVVNG